jgi:hypothetical protein
MRKVVVVLLIAGVAAQAQTIEMRQVGALVDRDGKGFTRAPMTIVPVGKLFAMTEMNELPLVVDSSGRLVKRFPKGAGPGEFETNAFPARVGAGDTLFIGNHQNVNVFDRDLKFVSSFTPAGLYVSAFVPIDGQFVFASRRAGATPNTIVSLHVVDRAGNVVRSFLVDTLPQPPRYPQPQYAVEKGAGSSIWSWSIAGRRLQRWSLDGRVLMTIDTTPAWFPQKDPLYKSRIMAVRESDGVLWVFTSVPVPNARAISATAFKGTGEADARAFPFEQQSTAWLEAFDVRTGKRLAERHIGKYGIGFIDDRHFMAYSTSKDDTTQLEIWELTLRR